MSNKQDLVICPVCGVEFDAYRHSTHKTRRGELYCSVECADRDHPDIAARNQENNSKITKPVTRK